MDKYMMETLAEVDMVLSLKETSSRIKRKV